MASEGGGACGGDGGSARTTPDRLLKFQLAARCGVCGFTAGDSSHVEQHVLTVHAVAVAVIKSTRKRQLADSSKAGSRGDRFRCNWNALCDERRSCGYTAATLDAVHQHALKAHQLVTLVVVGDGGVARDAAPDLPPASESTRENEQLEGGDRKRRRADATVAVQDNDCESNSDIECYEGDDGGASGGDDDEEGGGGEEEEWASCEVLLAEDLQLVTQLLTGDAPCVIRCRARISSDDVVDSDGEMPTVAAVDAQRGVPAHCPLLAQLATWPRERQVGHCAHLPLRPSPPVWKGRVCVLYVRLHGVALHRQERAFRDVGYAVSVPVKARGHKVRSAAGGTSLSESLVPAFYGVLHALDVSPALLGVATVMPPLRGQAAVRAVVDHVTLLCDRWPQADGCLGGAASSSLSRAAVASLQQIGWRAVEVVSDSDGAARGVRRGDDGKVRIGLYVRSSRDERGPVPLLGSFSNQQRVNCLIVSALARTYHLTASEVSVECVAYEVLSAYEHGVTNRPLLAVLLDNLRTNKLQYVVTCSLTR